jgi:hypothetical protein
MMMNADYASSVCPRVLCLDYCLNLWQCFSSFLFRTIRGDGLKDVMALPGEDFRFPTNIVDAFMGVDGYDSFAAKLAWDISFQVWFLYILLSIITGMMMITIHTYIRTVRLAKCTHMHMRTYYLLRWSLRSYVLRYHHRMY